MSEASHVSKCVVFSPGPHEGEKRTSTLSSDGGTCRLLERLMGRVAKTEDGAIGRQEGLGRERYGGPIQGSIYYSA